ncbi:preprotein translocase subunit SecA [Alphaproteobacteria bacterium]|nr:preprotein translocase subunit SecA [Alphaproteobacteria bacterium]
MFQKINDYFSSRKNSKLINEISDKYLKQVNSLEGEITKLSQEELIDKINLLKDNYFKNDYSALKEEDIFIICAIVRDVSKRTLGLRHFDSQIIGGIALYHGLIAEMKTGEGKTLVATIPIILNYIFGRRVHLITVNDYLAKRDSLWMGPIYEYLNISNSFIQNDQTIEEKIEAYNCHVVYGNNNEFCFDYLRDNLRSFRSPKMQKALQIAVIDEADSVLIDESRSPLGISGPVKTPIELFKLCYEITDDLIFDDVEINEERKNVLLKDSGIKKIEFNLKKINYLKGNSLFDNENLEAYQIINQSLKARFIFEKDKDYIVKDGQIIVIDEFSGRLSQGRRFGEGLHQSLEAKENVKIQSESITLASITFQNYFKKYEKISGMTGTALTEAEELLEIYGLSVVEVPTNKPMIRKDHNDQIYKTSEEKHLAILDLVKEKHSAGQPVLIGTTSIEKSNFISNLLEKSHIPHNVLNAKNHENEAEIIASAGKPSQITVATNMAGRGTDIKIGGNPDIDKNFNNADYQKVINFGGLCILGTERHESRRIDNQLRGRSGRQGDPGESIFFVSLEDDLMRIFGSEKLQSMLSTLGLKKGEVVEHKWLTSSIERAQKRIEGHNFDIRKQLLEFDNIIDKQRNIIYSKREMIISENIFEFILETEDEFITNLLEGENEEVENFKETLIHLKENDLNEKKDYLEKFNKIKSDNLEKHPDIYEKILRQVTLTILDKNWHNHIQELTNIRMSVSLSGYAGKDPVNEFRKASFSAFNQLIYEIQKQIVLVLNNMNIQDQSNDIQVKESDLSLTNKKFGRNDPCPCGSKKKYKHCHGRS